ncbi:MAG: hypothetical protein R3178_05710 [Rhodothermales bacterium]|nr:hypothetical protein [Rhodothermales bacterium]
MNDRWGFAMVLPSTVDQCPMDGPEEAWPTGQRKSLRGQVERFGLIAGKRLIPNAMDYAGDAVGFEGL